MTLSFWDKLTGAFEYPAFCPRCGRDVVPWKTRAVIHKFNCGKCKMVAVVTKAQVPDKCPGCGVGTSAWNWVQQMPETEKVPGEFCGACAIIIKEYQAELKKGGVPWRCVDCKGEGIEKAHTNFAKAVRSEHPDGALVQMSRQNGCPLCGHLARMEN